MIFQPLFFRRWVVPLRNWGEVNMSKDKNVDFANIQYLCPV